ncbi:MAG TPA: (2Fe-2S) ferredoxin domain-containing protein [Chloroflexota bacterium]|nr:(2Fe-2S) ferredoxin domain-containing protein [Chloroflexota bacterium]
MDGPFEKHLFVCTSGEYCPMIDGNGIEIHKAFKIAVAEAGLRGRVRVNNSGCLDQCGHGPNAVVYPENVWYSHLTLEDVPVIVEEHLKNGRPVERLRYHPPKAGANKLQRDDRDKRRAGQVDGCRADWPIIPLDDPRAGEALETAAGKPA